MSDIENIQSIIRKKINDLVNLQIKADKDDDFPLWESAENKIERLREHETSLTLIALEIDSIKLEVEEIGQQTDKV